MSRIESYLVTIDSVSLNILSEEILKTLRIRPQKQQEAKSIIEAGLGLISPKVIYVFTKVEGIEKSIVKLNVGQPIQSIILSEMLKIGQSIALFVLTIGEKLELEASVQAKTSVFKSWILEQTGDFALGKAFDQFKVKIEKVLGGKVSSFSPGEGTGRLFNIEQQKVIFDILAPQSNIGVSLTSSFLMIPRKSVSGILAVTTKEYVACEYCSRQKCANRKKPFSGEYYSINCKNNIQS